MRTAAALIAALAFGLAAWLVEVMVDRYRPELGVVWRFVILLALALTAIVVTVGIAGAHDSATRP